MTVRNLYFVVFSALVFVFTAALFSVQASAQPSPEELLDQASEEIKERLTGEDAEEAAPEMPPEMAAMMEAWQAANTPGEEHARLGWFEGQWNTRASHWMGPGEPQTSSGTSTMEMVLGGRYLHDRHDSEWMGEPFTGLGYTGYDNMAGHYNSLWLDSMSTGMFTGSGHFDAEANRYEYNAEYSEPGEDGRTIPVRYELVIDSDDQFTFNWYEDRGEGEMKTMEIVYTRVR